ncbi:spike base protein, RCAP_Rcc01079 family [Asticcacaulis solisilvae]|uniref:spike base protein, RCAP_Rcc01079 family n=1 Tax=Asticcacaulis solisilvae TaxID=1217274 RepID=UPI003FD7D658
MPLSLAVEKLDAGMTQPITGAAPVTPSDNTDLANGPCRAIWVEGAGVVKMTLAAGDVVTLTLGAGFAHPFVATRIWSTGTTATGVVVLY